MTMIRIDNITKRYGDNVGNFNINLEVQDGEAFAILGANGAGKTTLIRQMLGFIKPDEGQILIDGLDPQKDAKKIMESTSYVSGELAIYENLKGIQYLKLVASLKENVEWEFVENLIKHFDLDPKKKIKKMSKGNKQKVVLIAAAMNKPKFLILDEPTSGLDPVMQEQFNQLILKFKNEYKSTIIVCSHILEEVAALCDRIGFIKEGHLVETLSIDKTSYKEIDKRFKEIYKKEKFI